jgi:hypothetical protein
MTKIASYNSLLNSSCYYYKRKRYVNHAAAIPKDARLSILWSLPEIGPMDGRCPGISTDPSYREKLHARA